MKIAIVGAGVVGVTTAFELALDGHAVTVFEQRSATASLFAARQMLQPIHSRISSARPSRIFSGKNGSAIEGRAAPMKSCTPRLICATMVSGEVNRPTETTGLLVRLFTKPT